MKYIHSSYYGKTKLIHLFNHATDFDKTFEAIQRERKKNAFFLELTDSNNISLWYNITDETKENIEAIKNLGRHKIEDIIPDQYKPTSLKETLIDEALGSSSIEGAYSTRRQAKEMIDKNLKPKNKSQMMIKNNYKGLLFTFKKIDEPITKNFVLDLWKILTEKTLKKEDITTGYRDDRVFIQNAVSGERIHEGAPADQLDKKMNALYDFVNNYTIDEALIKACILQYYFLDLHPFFDGNGRTARALMNKYLISQGYTFFKYFSISKILSEKRSQYYAAIKKCQNHDNDLTFFIDFYTKLMLETLTSIKETYLARYIPIIIQSFLKELMIPLNDRQIDAINFFFKTKKLQIDNKMYQKKFSVTQETARKDLDKLVSLGIISKKTKGKKFVYRKKSLSDIIEFLDDI